MCFNHFDTYGACSHSIRQTIPCPFQLANPHLKCHHTDITGKSHPFDFCPGKECQLKSQVIEAANAQEALKKEKSLRHKASRKLSNGWGRIKNDIKSPARRRSHPRYYSSEVSNLSIPELPALSMTEDLVGYPYPLPTVVERQSFPVMKKKRDQKTFVGDFEKSFSAPSNASSDAIAQGWGDAASILHDTASTKNVINDKVQRESWASRGSERHAQPYRDLIGSGPYDNEEEEPGLYRESGGTTLPTRQPSYKKPPSPPGNFRRVPSQTNTPQGSPPPERAHRGSSQSSRPRASTPPKPKRVPPLPKKEPQLYHGQPAERDIIISSRSRRSPNHSQEKLAPPKSSRRPAPPTKPKENDRMSVITTMADFLTEPLPNNVESRRVGSKLADGSYDHRRLQQEKQRNVAINPRPGMGNGKKIQPTLRLLAAKNINRLEVGSSELQVVKSREERPVGGVTEWPAELAQIQEGEDVPQAKGKLLAHDLIEQDERRASEERKRTEIARLVGDEPYFGPYANQGGISQKVSPPFPYQQQVLDKPSPRTSLDDQQGRCKEKRHPPQDSSPPRLDMLKQNAFSKNTSSNEYPDTKGIKRRSKNLFPPKTDTSNQASIPENAPPNDQFDIHSPHSSSPLRTKSKQPSFSEGASSDGKAAVHRRNKRSPQNSSSPRNETKHNSFPQQGNTQRRRRSPQNPSPTRNDTSKQSSFSHGTAPNQQVTVHKRGKHSLQNTSPTRKDSPKRTSMTQKQDSYKDSDKNWGQDSYLIKQAGTLGCSTAEAEQDRIKRTAEKEMQEKREEERMAKVERDEAERITGMQRLKQEERERKTAVEKVAREKKELAEARMQAVREREKVEVDAKKEADEVEALRQADLSACRTRDMRPGYSMPWPPKRHPDDKGRPYTMDHDGKLL